MFLALRTRAATSAAAGALALVAFSPVVGVLGEGLSTAGERSAARHAQPPAGQPRVNLDAALAVDFTKRAQEYMALHKKAVSSLPALPREATPEQIDQHQRALGRAIQQLRPRAQPSELFSKEIRAYLRRQLDGVFSGMEGRKLKASIMDENPGPIKLRINSRYPDTVPLTTMPPQVLAALPKLPEDLEYRFIGERLILLDVPAHLIVDFIEDALPR